MTSEDRARLLEHWWEHGRLSQGNREERKALANGYPPGPAWAYDELSELVDEGSTKVVALLADLIDACPTDSGPSIVGTGPLEDLVNQHGDALVSELETLARRRPSFRSALSSVAIEQGSITDSAASRIDDLTS